MLSILFLYIEPFHGLLSSILKPVVHKPSLAFFGPTLATPDTNVHTSTIRQEPCIEAERELVVGTTDTTTTRRYSTIAERDMPASSPNQMPEAVLGYSTEPVRSKRIRPHSIASRRQAMHSTIATTSTLNTTAPDTATNTQQTIATEAAAQRAIIKEHEPTYDDSYEYLWSDDENDSANRNVKRQTDNRIMNYVEGNDDPVQVLNTLRSMVDVLHRVDSFITKRLQVLIRVIASIYDIDRY